MSISLYLRLTLFAFVPWLMVSCASNKPSWGEGLGHFHEDATTDMVLRFYRWDSIYMTKPESRENGFLPVLSKDDIPREVQRRNIGRNLAVVIVGFTYAIDPQSALVRDWKALLGGQGFRRVVFLRASSGNKGRIDGLPILLDSVIAASHDTQGQFAPAIAAVPPATGADAANSPGRSVR